MYFALNSLAGGLGKNCKCLKPVCLCLLSCWHLPSRTREDRIFPYWQKIFSWDTSQISSKRRGETLVTSTWEKCFWNYNTDICCHTSQHKRPLKSESTILEEGDVLPLSKLSCPAKQLMYCIFVMGIGIFCYSTSYVIWCSVLSFGHIHLTTCIAIFTVEILCCHDCFILGLMFLSKRVQLRLLYACGK